MPWKLKILCWAIYAVVRTIYVTLRLRVVNSEILDTAKKKSPTGAVILVLWHEHAMASIISHKGQNFHPVVSLSKDGEIVDFTSKRFGNPCIRGSSSRGGLRARNEAVAYLKRGESVAFTVDGPKGPRHEVKPGCVETARSTGSPIIPTCAVASRSWILRKTWDQTRIVKFFSKVTLTYGEPIWVDENVSDEDFYTYVQTVRAAIMKLEET